MKIAGPTKKYNISEHLVYACQYHVIFCPKYRRRVLTDGIEVRLKEIFNEVKEKYRFEILEMEIMPDHVHLIIDVNPRFGIMECVRKLKGASSRTLRKEFPPAEVGLDIGPSTIAHVSFTVAKLETFCDPLENKQKEIRRLQRKLDRQRRANNPQNYNADGTIKKGRKIWHDSNQYIKTKNRLNEIQRKQAAHRKSLHGNLANRIYQN